MSRLSDPIKTLERVAEFMVRTDPFEGGEGDGRRGRKSRMPPRTTSPNPGQLSVRGHHDTSVVEALRTGRGGRQNYKRSTHPSQGAKPRRSARVRARAKLGMGSRFADCSHRLVYVRRLAISHPVNDVLGAFRAPRRVPRRTSFALSGSGIV